MMASEELPGRTIFQRQVATWNLLLAIVMFNGVLSAAEPDAKWLGGRVTDQQGVPLSSALVIATPMRIPGRSAFVLETMTNEMGDFSWSNAVANESYCLEIRKAGFDYSALNATSGEKAATHKLTQLISKTVAGIVEDQDEKPLADATVFLVGEFHQVYRHEIEVSSAGQFELEIADDIGQGIAYAERDGLRSKYVDVRQGTEELRLVVEKPCVLEGRVTDEHGDGIGHCTIKARPDFVTGFSRTVISNEDGTYRFSDLPRGAYVMRALHERWFDPTMMELDPKEVKLVADETLQRDFTLREKSKINGLVLGPDNKPLAGATVVAPADRIFYGGKYYTETKTDGNGEYELFVDSRLVERFDSHVAAVHDELGASRVPMKREPVVLALGGRMSVSGKVVDEAGQPLQHIIVRSQDQSWTNTDKDGQFQFDGLLIDGASKSAAITVGHSFLPVAKLGERMDLSDFALYSQLRETVPAKHGSTVHLELTLPKAKLLRIHGTVSVKGKPVPSAQLVLLNRMPEPNDKWKHHLGEGPGRFALGGRKSLLRRISRTITDDDGKFELFAIDRGKGGSFAVGAAADGGSTQLSRVSLGPDDTETSVEFKFD